MYLDSTFRCWKRYAGNDSRRTNSPFIVPARPKWIFWRWMLRIACSLLIEFQSIADWRRHLWLGLWTFISSIRSKAFLQLLDDFKSNLEHRIKWKISSCKCAYPWKIIQASEKRFWRNQERNFSDFKQLDFQRGTEKSFVVLYREGCNWVLWNISAHWKAWTILEIRSDFSEENGALCRPDESKRQKFTALKDQTIIYPFKASPAERYACQSRTARIYYELNYLINIPSLWTISLNRVNYFRKGLPDAFEQVDDKEDAYKQLQKHRECIKTLSHEVPN